MIKIVEKHLYLMVFRAICVVKYNSSQPLSIKPGSLI